MENCNFCGAEGTGLFCAHCGKKKTVSVATSHPQESALELSAAPIENLLVEPDFASRDLPQRGFFVSQIPDTLGLVAEGEVTLDGTALIVDSDERPAWNGRPAPLTIADLGSRWALGILGSALLALFLHGGWGWVGFWLIVGAIRLGLYYIALRLIRYRVSTERVEITDGLLHRQTRTYEVFELEDAIIDSPLPLQLAGLSNLTILHRYGTVDNRSRWARIFSPPASDFIPRSITLLGIPSEEARVVRDLIRQAGQHEAGRLDKIRFRH